MIALDMMKKKEGRITDKHYTIENNILTIQFGAGDYDLAGKTITAVFSPSGVETAPLTASEGVISVPVYSDYIEAGVNYIQLYFRWDTNKVENSGKYLWVVEASLPSTEVSDQDVDIVTALIAQANAAIDTAEALKGIDTIERTAGDGSPGTLDTYTITYTDATTTTFQVLNGPVGPQGVQGDGLEFNWSGTQLGVRVEGEPAYTYVDLKGDKGEPGGNVILDDSTTDPLKVWSSDKVSTQLAEVTNQLTQHKIDYASQVQVPIKNLVTNGDFSNGITGWTVIGATYSISNGKIKLSFNGTSYTPQIQKTNLNLIEGRKYYLGFEYYTNDLTNNKLSRFEPPPYLTVFDSVNIPNKVTRIITGTANKTTLIFMNNGYTNHLPLNSEWSEIGNICMIDLTETFGAGNEPTIEEMDELMTYFPNSWFDGTQDLANNKWFMTYMLKKLRGKANVVQEAWITPTLNSPWSAITSNPPKYFKDTLGFVHIRGEVGTGTSLLTIFTLPPGYRPNDRTMFSRPSSTAGTSHTNFIIQSTGEVTSGGTAVLFGEVIFKADK